MNSSIRSGSKAYYLSKSNKILTVVVFWAGITKTGKAMAKVGFPGKSEAEAFWVDADRLSLARHTLERAQREMRDDCGIY
jgi:hypothetical protein